MGGMMRMMMGGGMGGAPGAGMAEGVGGPGLTGGLPTPTPPRMGVPPSGFAIGGTAGIPSARAPKPMSFTDMLGQTFKDRLMQRPGGRFASGMMGIPAPGMSAEDAEQDKLKNALMMLVRGGMR